MGNAGRPGSRTVAPVQCFDPKGEARSRVFGVQGHGESLLSTGLGLYPMRPLGSPESAVLIGIIIGLICLGVLAWESDRLGTRAQWVLFLVVGPLLACAMVFDTHQLALASAAVVASFIITMCGLLVEDYG